MKKGLLAAAALAFSTAALVAGAAYADDGPPPWAYGFSTPLVPGTPPAEPTPAQILDNVKLYSLPGSKFSFTRAQIADRYGPADWFPEDHPAMPEIVAKGKVLAQPQVYACSLCHYPNGNGRPENANITGLSYEYFMQQMMDFRNGVRKTSDPRKANTGLMMRFSRMMTDDETIAAAKYFTAMPAVPWITVSESAEVPKTNPQNGMFLKIEGEGAGLEPIGTRIMEIPENTREAEFMRNPRSGFIAYVPPGSVKKGESLVLNGVTAAGAAVTPCTVCHGGDLRGLGPAPTLAGRSPSYIARQLYDMQHGNRHGAWTPLMAAVVTPLVPDDLITAAAYLASRKP